jgi:hypothetical protein
MPTSTTTNRRKATTTVPRAPKSTATTATAATTTATSGAGQQFRAADYLPGDLFSASSNAPSLSAEDFAARQEKIAGQLRAVKVAQSNLTLIRELQTAEGIGLEGHIIAAKNAVLGEKLTTQGVKLQQQVTTTDIERARLHGLEIDRQGERDSLPLRQEAWDLKLEGLRADIDSARALLAEKRSQLPQTIDTTAR